MTSGTAANPPPVATDKPPRFRLRTDLRVTTGEDGGFVLEDPRQGKFFRLGPAEYAIVAQLDGQTDLREAFIQAAKCRNCPQPTAERFAKLQSWLLSSGLVETGTEKSFPSGSSNSPSPSAPNVNPCYFRYSFGNPARLLTGFDRVVGWLFSLPAMIVVILMSLGAAIFVFQQWVNLTSSLSGILCPDQHLALFGCWLVLKTAHEIGHGIACRRLGGEVREWGLAFIYLMPVPYTDVTSSWRFSSRFDRMAVAAAGMYVEWIIALLALLIWSCTSSAAVQHLCVYTISLATVTTVLFNANPLCRLDGYFILSDLLGWPNFSAQAQRVAGSFLQRLVWGIRSTGEPKIAGRRYWMLLSYGIAAAAWRWLALISMAVVVLVAYEGLGALLIAGVLIAWYGPFRSGSTSSFVDHLRSMIRQPQWILRLSLIAGGCVTLGYFLPWPFPVTAPGIVENSQQHTVRARAAGQVVSLHVADGEWVEAGQKLVVLKNDELAFELRHLELSLAHGEAKLRSLHSKRQLVDYQVQQQRQETLALQIAEQRRKLESLTLRAPAAGHVLARRLADLPDSFLKEGAEVCTIVEPGMQLRVSIAESELPFFESQIEKPIEVRLPDRTLSGVLTSLDPNASIALSDPSFSAAAGGPLPVTMGQSAGDTGSEPKEGQLLAPRVTGTITLSADDWPALRAGQRASAAIHPESRKLTEVIAGYGRNWFHDIQQNSQRSARQ